VAPQISGDPQAATWVWLSQSEVDFGGAKPAGTEEERIVWLHADPFRALGLPHSSHPDEKRRARRRLAKTYHPDTGGADSLRRFQEMESASRAIDGPTEVLVEPIRGEWWRFAGFATPDPVQRADRAVLGLAFEIHDLTRVPIAVGEDSVRITYADQVLPLGIRYSGGRFAMPVLVARLSAFTESAALVLLCMTLFPIVAVLLALDMYLLSGLNAFAFWAVALMILAAGYGALAMTLVKTGRPVPYPRRAVFRARASAADVRSLVRGRPAKP
jgi:hypothetical protein